MLILFILVECITSENSLYNHLLSNYDSRVPALTNGIWSKIYHGVDLSWLSNVNTKTSEFEAIFQFELFWRDDRLKWNPILFKNLSRISLEANHFWTPKISIFESGQLDYKDSVALISSNGFVQIIFDKKVSGFCMVEQKYYPYDEHDCGLTFISEIGDSHGTA